MGYRDVNAFVPVSKIFYIGGYNRIPECPPAEKLRTLPVGEKINRGKLAITAFGDFKKAKKAGDEVAACQG